MIRRSKRARLRNKAVKELDALARQEVFERDNATCQRCGSTENPQWSHIITREYYSVRWNPDNAVVHCRDCHCWFTNHHTVGIWWFSNKFPDRWQRINKLVQDGVKVNPIMLLAERRDGNSLTI